MDNVINLSSHLGFPFWRYIYYKQPIWRYIYTKYNLL